MNLLKVRFGARKAQQGQDQEEGASWNATRSVVTSGRGERIRSGIWNVREEPVTLEEILPFSLQKIEIMVVEALKIQADVVEEAPFDISPLRGGEDPCKLINSAKPLEEHQRKATGEEGIARWLGHGGGIGAVKSSSGGQQQGRREV